MLGEVPSSRQLAGVASANTNDLSLARLGKLAGRRIAVIRLSERRDRAKFASDYLISTLLMNRAAAQIAELSARVGGGSDAEERLSLQAPRETSDRSIARAWARAYPLLQREGRELASSGVEFVDATGLFDERQEAVYADD